jgi:protein-disulfide isomerase
LAPALRLGPAGAPIQTVEFTDFECPYCRQFHATLRSVRQRFGESVAVNLVHFPLPMHRFAFPAARAAECAERQGRFSWFVDVVYGKQDSLGLKTWTSYAKDAQVGDTALFLRCVTDTARVPRIDAGVALGKRINIVSTPTVIVNGWRIDGTPPESLVIRVVSDLLTGREPFSRSDGGRAPRASPDSSR